MRARARVVALVALGVARHALRLAPTLAIGLAIDRVAGAQATATLAAIVSGLCLLALVETLFSAAHQRQREALTSHLGAVAGGGDRRGGAAHAACVDLVARCGAAPPVLLAMIAAIALASPRLAALVATLLAAQAAASAIATSARTRLTRSLRIAERIVRAADAEAGAGRGLGPLQAPARRRARLCDLGRARIAALLERHRAATGNAAALVERLGFAAVLALASLDVMSASITPGALIATLLVLRQLQGLVDGIANAWLRAIETAPVPERDAATPRPGPRPGSIDVAPGEFVVVVGATGAGKSTLLRALVERHRPPAADRRSIAWVEQQPLLCDRSIAGTLRLAAPNADARRIAQALQVSQLGRVLAPLPAGADLPCGPRGENLPAGTRHLVALAAALARDPRLLVIDGLPEALDAPLRMALLAALQSWRADARGLVVATSSPSWIAAADRVIVLDRGRVRADIRPRRARESA